MFWMLCDIKEGVEGEGESTLKCANMFMVALHFPLCVSYYIME